MKRAVTLVLVILMAAAGLFGGRWYLYVAHGDSPYDEVGIALNTHMPAPLRAWGCARMAARFAGTVPPYGCTAAEGAGG